MKKNIIFLILVSVVIISGCIGQIACNPPYILVGTECCLDVNENNICDVDETGTSVITTTAATTARTTIPGTTIKTTITITTTIPQRVGVLDVKNEFFVVCKKSSKNEEWCSVETYDSTNEVTIDTGSLGAQEHNLAEIATWVYNKGNSDIINISYDISCDQTYPTFESRVLTSDIDKYKTVMPTIYFRCTGCSLGCICTPQRYGQIINRMKLGDETTFRIELLSLKYFPEKTDLNCILKIYSEDPIVEHSFNLIIHFNV